MPDDAKPLAILPAPADPRSLNLHQRLHAVMMDVTYVQKDRKIDMGSKGYMVVTHDAVTAKVRPMLVKHRVAYYPQGLTYIQTGNRTEITLTVDFVNIDDPQDRIKIPTIGFGIDQGDKGPGKAISYAVKYALLKALGLETGEDADLDGEVKHDPTAAPAEQPLKSPPERPMTKQQARPEYDKLLKEMHQIQTPHELAQWGKRTKAILDAMPADWQISLRDEYTDHKTSLMERGI